MGQNDNLGKTQNQHSPTKDSHLVNASLVQKELVEDVCIVTMLKTKSVYTIWPRTVLVGCRNLRADRMIKIQSRVASVSCRPSPGTAYSFCSYTGATGFAVSVDLVLYIV